MNDKKLRIALYQPDIPQNTGAAMRMCACLDIGLDIIEPCGFLWDARKIKQSAMDYYDHTDLTRHSSWKKFLDQYQDKRRIVLLTTKAAVPYTSFSFQGDDILLAGSESAGVPDHVHETVNARIVIPMKHGMRSMNVINSCAMITSEAIRQTKLHDLDIGRSNDVRKTGTNE